MVTKEKSFRDPGLSGRRSIAGIGASVPLALAIGAGFVVGIVGVAFIHDGASPPPSHTGTRLFAAFIPGSNDMRLLGEGWAKPESWGTWTIGPRAELKLPLSRRPASDVHLSITGRIYPWYAKLEQSVRVNANGTQVAKLERGIDGDLYGGSFFIPLHVARAASPIRIVFEIKNPTAPNSIDDNPDSRPLGLGLGSIEVTYDGE